MSGDHLLQEFLLFLQVAPAEITKEFNLYLAGGRAVKKIEISNPYDREKIFRIHSAKSSGNSVRVLHNRVRVPAISTTKIDVEFSGTQGRFVIFVNGL